MNRKRRAPHPKTAAERAKRGVIDDTLATVAVFSMAPEQIIDENPDPRGVEIGRRAAEIVRRQLAQARQAQQARQADPADAPTSPADDAAE